MGRWGTPIAAFRMTTLLAFLFTLALLIVIHELGHYSVARWAKVRILRFSVGFGRPLYKRVDAHGTEWVVAGIPLGGYVKMLDERESEQPIAESERPFAFNRQSLGKRAAIVVAGPVANFLLAIVLLWGLYLHGVSALRPVLDTPAAATPAALAGIQQGEMVRRLNAQTVDDWQGFAEALLSENQHDAYLELEDAQGYVRRVTLPLEDLLAAAQTSAPLDYLGLKPGRPPLPPIVGDVLPDSPAARAGLQPGDRITQAATVAVTDWAELVERIHAHAGKPLWLSVVRGERQWDIEITPDSVHERGTAIGRIGVTPQLDPAWSERLRVVHAYGPIDAVGKAIERTWALSVFSLRMLGRMLLGEVSLSNLSGPLSIADYAGQSAEAGWVPFVGFLALISISLGVLNLLPIPMLDGGHLLYYFAEFVTGRPVSARIQELAQRLGMVLLLILMTFALYNDLTRLFSS